MVTITCIQPKSSFGQSRGLCIRSMHYNWTCRSRLGLHWCPTNDFNVKFQIGTWVWDWDQLPAYPLWKHSVEAVCIDRYTLMHIVFPLFPLPKVVNRKNFLGGNTNNMKAYSGWTFLLQVAIDSLNKYIHNWATGKALANILHSYWVRCNVLIYAVFLNMEHRYVPTAPQYTLIILHGTSKGISFKPPNALRTVSST